MGGEKVMLSKMIKNYLFTPYSQRLTRLIVSLVVLFGVLFFLPYYPSQAQTTTLYTVPVSGAGGGISGIVDRELTHALALNRDRVQCFRGALSDGGRSFKIASLPTGKYDLILVTKAGAVCEGIDLGEDVSKLSTVSLKNAEGRVMKSDTFFNKYKIHRAGLIEGGEKQLLFVERVRDKQILKQSGEVLNADLRRLEVVELIKAADDWQFLNTRHLYREEAQLGAGLGFFTDKFVPTLGNVRVIDSVKNLGSIALPQ